MSTPLYNDFHATYGDIFRLENKILRSQEGAACIEKHLSKQFLVQGNEQEQAWHTAISIIIRMHA